MNATRREEAAMPMIPETDFGNARAGRQPW
jgi:hypothetical protein